MNVLHFNNQKLFRKNTWDGRRGQNKKTKPTTRKTHKNCWVTVHLPKEKRNLKIHLVKVFEEFGLCFSVIDKYAIANFPFQVYLPHVDVQHHVILVQFLYLLLCNCLLWETNEKKLCGIGLKYLSKFECLGWEELASKTYLRNVPCPSPVENVSVWDHSPARPLSFAAFTHTDQIHSCQQHFPHFQLRYVFKYFSFGPNRSSPVLRLYSTFPTKSTKKDKSVPSPAAPSSGPARAPLAGVSEQKPGFRQSLSQAELSGERCQHYCSLSCSGITLPSWAAAENSFHRLLQEESLVRAWVFAASVWPCSHPRVRCLSDVCSSTARTSPPCAQHSHSYTF